ncbi:hypothetical protein GQ44DRAFT_710259 [Phaeosphaeriaceae sp. PMI808]|nr:hypothetical protein GQ44DRAFT_710259 [Phaeosphaeriaceae sp. PMI808]
MMPKCSKSCRMTIELINQMLSMNDKDRPTARRVTGTLRLITLYEAADSVEKLLYIIQSNDSFDSLIERTRFQAWRYALGILEAQTVADFAKEASEWHINQFGSMLDTLRRTREWLNSIISNPKNIATGYPFHLTVLNDSLDESLSERLQEISKSYFKTSILQDVGGDSSLLLPREIRLRAALKHMTGLALQHYERDTCRRQLDVRLVKIGAAFEDHNIGKYQVSSGLHPVLVEWRYYGRQTSDKAVNYELLVRVDAIAELLSQEKPEEFCALDCRGFFHDTSRSAFGVIYDYPQTTGLSQGTLTPQSLHHLLKETFQKGERHPTLDDKFRVAYILCRSVLEFHLVNWLHKRLCSSNVAFFHTTESLEDEWFQKPYIVGFNHSRPDEPSAFTGGPEESSINHYQHPLYLSDSRRFCADFDYYSLGIILLEIGLWRPLESMTRRYKGSYEEIRQLLIRERVPLLKQCMGRAYCEVVEICLRGTFGGSELTDKQAPVADSLQSNFNMMVVQKLKGLSELS